jgi:hypothetical protein
MKIGTGVQAILKFCLRNLRGCNVCIPDRTNFFNYAFEISTDAMIYVSGFIKIGSGIQKLIRRDIQTHRQQGNLINLVSFFKIRKAG